MEIAGRVVLSQVIPTWLWSGCTPGQFPTTKHPKKTQVHLQMFDEDSAVVKLKCFRSQKHWFSWRLHWLRRNIFKFSMWKYAGCCTICYYFFTRLSGFLKSFSMTLRVQTVQFSGHKTKNKIQRGRTGLSPHGWLDKEPCFMLCTRTHDKNILVPVIPCSRLAPGPAQEVWQCICSLPEWHPWRVWRHCWCFKFQFLYFWYSQLGWGGERMGTPPHKMWVRKEMMLEGAESTWPISRSQINIIAWTVPQHSYDFYKISEAKNLGLNLKW